MNGEKVKCTLVTQNCAQCLQLSAYVMRTTLQKFRKPNKSSPSYEVLMGER